MADRFWVGGNGNWDASTTTHWSATPGGAGGASVPTISDDVYLQQSSTTTVILTTDISINYLLTECIFDANDHNITVGDVSLGDDILKTATVYMGSGTWTITNQNFIAGVVGTTVYAETSTIIFTNPGTGDTSLDSLGYTFYNVKVATNLDSVMRFFNGGNFNKITINKGRECVFQNAVFYLNEFVAIGTSGNLITLSSDLGDGTKIISIASGIVSCNYLSLTDFPVGGGATWYAGSNSTNGGGNEGWIFSNYIAVSENANIDENDVKVWLGYNENRNIIEPIYVDPVTDALLVYRVDADDLTQTEIIDSYSEANRNNANIFAPNRVYGQTFTTNNIAYKLDSCKFFLQKSASVGSLYAKLYAITGTPGTGATPTGSALATSTVVDAATTPGAYGLVTFNFTGANRIDLSKNTNYAICIDWPTAGGSGTIYFGVQNPGGTHSGNYIYSFDGGASFTGTDVYDANFYVYGERFAITATNNNKIDENHVKTISGYNETTGKVESLRCGDGGELLIII